MRFLHLNHRYAPYVGGSERYMQEVSAMLAGDGHQVSVITSNASDLEYFWDPRMKPLNAPERECMDGVDVRRMRVDHGPLSPFVFQGSRRVMGEVSRGLSTARPYEMVASRLPRMPQLRWTMEQVGRVDLVHATNLGLEGMAIAAQRRAESLSVPFLLTPFIHLGSSSDTVARRYVSMPHHTKLLRAANHIVVMTQIEASFVKTLDISMDRLTVSGVGIDPCEVTGGDASRFRKRHRIEGALIGTAGAVAFEKGSRELVVAVGNLRKRGHAIELFLAGPRLRDFDDWFSSLDDTSRMGIHAPGFITPDEKRDMLAALDVLAMPSRTESFGIAYLEGWVNRKPVLAARAGAVPELVLDGENGVLVEFGNVSEIESGILRLLLATDVARRMGDAGFGLTMERYTWSKVLERVRGAYGAALGYEIRGNLTMPESQDAITAQANRLRRAILRRHGYTNDESPSGMATSAIDDATRLATVTVHWGIVSDIPVVGRVVVLVKRALRIALRWYINPIVAQQNAFNEAVVRTLHELQTENDRLRATLSERDPGTDE